MSQKLMSAKTFLADAIGASATAIPDDAHVTDYSSWDSIVHLRLVLALEAHLGRELDSDEAISIESLQNIADLLGRSSRSEP
jgi:acyl carrier protein